MAFRTSLLAVLAAACATPGAAPPRDHSFQNVRKIALVRRAEDPGAVRGKDPLDALRDSLAERGYDVRIVEIGRRRSAAREVESLYFQVDRRVAAGAPSDRLGRRMADVSASAASAALAALGADAMAVYHRLAGQPMLLPPMSGDPFDPLSRPGALYAPRSDAVPYRPLGAVSLVDREGKLVWFDWGAQALEDPDVPANAAEAVDALLRVLAGQPADDS